jgi:apolipoprotein D and lipocalin family protein
VKFNYIPSVAKITSAILLCSLLSACAHNTESSYESLPKADDVDLDRFMGRWYVIANIPTFIEKTAHNATEDYVMNDDGSIATTFSFNEDSFDGEQKTYTPTGYVSEQNNSLWGMQFIWPFKAEYVIAYLSEDYQHTIIARSARDYLWIMSRQPEISEFDYQQLISYCEAMGYDISLIRKVPQYWPDNAYRQSTNSLMQYVLNNKSQLGSKEF